jgi:hypothetical protein
MGTKRRRAAAIIAVLLIVPAGLHAGRLIKTYWLTPSVDEEMQQLFGRLQSAGEGVDELFNLDDLRIPREAIRHGGPPKDGIPSLTDPAVIPADEADFVDDDDRVIGVTINGASRAYPIRILNYHEAVNDELGGVPLAVVFCPLCDSATVVDRRVNGKTYEFGVSGFLYNSNVLLYDRTDDALWSQVEFLAVSGPNAGSPLRSAGSWEMSRFGAWRAAHPDATVLSLETGHLRGYGESRYRQYLDSDDLWFPVAHESALLPSKSRVVGVMSGDLARAYPLVTLAAGGPRQIIDEIDGARVVLRIDGPDTAAILEAPDGATVMQTFWFAWYAFHPETEVYGEDGP